VTKEKQRAYSYTTQFRIPDIIRRDTITPSHQISLPHPITNKPIPDLPPYSKHTLPTHSPKPGQSQAHNNLQPHSPLLQLLLRKPHPLDQQLRRTITPNRTPQKQHRKLLCLRIEIMFRVKSASSFISH